MVASWVSRIPAIRDAHGLSPGELGAFLLALSAGAITAMPLTGRLIHSYGSRTMTIAATAAFCVALPLIPLAPGRVLLGMALYLFGAMAGAMDVSMNAEAVKLEEQYGRPIMSSFHALFSIGGMIGAAAGGAIAGLRVMPLSHFALGAIAFGVMSAMVVRHLPPAHVDTSVAFSFRFNRVVATLGMLGFCIMMGEGAMADWTAIYLRDSVGTGAGLAAIGYAVFSGFMAAGRLAGDSLTARFGRARIVRAGGLLAAAGLAFALLAGSLWSALIGFAFVGAGFSVIIPLVFAASGRIPGMHPGASIAAVTTAAYTGFLTGPPLIGFTAEFTSLRAALGIIVVLSVAGAMLARAAEPNHS